MKRTNPNHPIGRRNVLGAAAALSGGHWGRSHRWAKPGSRSRKARETTPPATRDRSTRCLPARIPIPTARGTTYGCDQFHY
jgi:hypothetical protein